MAALSKEQKWYDVIRQVYNASPRGWMQDFIVQELLFKFCRTGYEHTDPNVLAEIERMMEMLDEQYANDPTYGGTPFPMPPMSVVRREEPLPGAQPTRGTTTAMNPYGTALKIVFNITPAQQTDEEKAAIAIATAHVTEFLQQRSFLPGSASAGSDNAGEPDLEDDKH